MVDDGLKQSVFSRLTRGLVLMGYLVFKTCVLGSAFSQSLVNTKGQTIVSHIAVQLVIMMLLPTRRKFSASHRAKKVPGPYRLPIKL